MIGSMKGEDAAPRRFCCRIDDGLGPDNRGLAAGRGPSFRRRIADPAAGRSRTVTFASYMLVVVAPFASTLLALRWFPGDDQPQPATRLARSGAGAASARERPGPSAYGASGMMVSLLVG